MPAYQRDTGRTPSRAEIAITHSTGAREAPFRFQGVLMAKENINNVAPALAVFGLDGSKRAHGSYFHQDEVDRGIKAAMTAGLFALRVAGDELSGLAAQLPRGKLFDSGSAFVPFVAMPTFTKLMAAAEAAGDNLMRPEVLLAERPAKPKSMAANGPSVPTKSEPVPAAPYRVPADWSTITVGCLVLAADDPADGYYPAIIVWVDDEKKGKEREVAVQFRDFPQYAQIRRRIDELGLLHPSVTGEVPQQPA